ncbi:hypothetical protein ACHAXS_012853, partial [Conticribra weissflogii]
GAGAGAGARDGDTARDRSRSRSKSQGRNTHGTGAVITAADFNRSANKSHRKKTPAACNQTKQEIPIAQREEVKMATPYSASLPGKNHDYVASRVMNSTKTSSQRRTASVPKAHVAAIKGGTHLGKKANSPQTVGSSSMKSKTISSSQNDASESTKEFIESMTVENPSTAPTSRTEKNTTSNDDNAGDVPTQNDSAFSPKKSRTGSVWNKIFGNSIISASTPSGNASSSQSTSTEKNPTTTANNTGNDMVDGVVIVTDEEKTYAEPMDINKSYRAKIINGHKIHSRTLIPPTVYQSPVTDLWITTISTNAHFSANTVDKDNASSDNISTNESSSSAKTPGSTKPPSSSENSNNTNTNGSTNSSTKGSSTSKYLKAFSYLTEKEARACAYANAPPQMNPFSNAPNCTLCNIKFSPLFKRPKHCRNCGIVICSSCCEYWKSIMVPDTYNIKKANVVKVCKSCHHLAREFRKALLNGEYGLAVELFQTGNVNLRCPFAFSGEEIMFPVHCAIEGNSEKLLRWLVDVQFCPIKVVSTGNKGKSISLKPGNNSSTNGVGNGYLHTLRTSKGRSVLSIAMSTKHVEILRYLVNEKDVSFYEIKDVIEANKTKDIDMVLGAMDAVVRAIPIPLSVQSEEDEKSTAVKSTATSLGPLLFSISKDTTVCAKNTNRNTPSPFGSRSRSSQNNVSGIMELDETGEEEETSEIENKNDCSDVKDDNEPTTEYVHQLSIVPPPEPKIIHPADVYASKTNMSFPEDYDSDEDKVENDDLQTSDDGSVSTTVPDICIECNLEAIDTIATPCGHQVCCSRCTVNRKTCPQCNGECQFIEILQL